MSLHLSIHMHVFLGLHFFHYITRQILDLDPRYDCPLLRCESSATVLQNWVTPPAFMTTTPVPGQATEAGALTSRAQSKRQILLCLSGLQTYSDSRWYPFYNPFLRLTKNTIFFHLQNSGIFQAVQTEITLD